MEYAETRASRDFRPGKRESRHATDRSGLGAEILAHRDVDPGFMVPRFMVPTEGPATS